MKDRPDMPAQYNQGLVGLRAAEASKGICSTHLANIGKQIPMLVIPRREGFH